MQSKYKNVGIEDRSPSSSRDLRVNAHGLWRSGTGAKFVPFRESRTCPVLTIRYAPEGPTGSNSTGHPPVFKFDGFPFTSMGDQVRPPFVLTWMNPTLLYDQSTFPPLLVQTWSSSPAMEPGLLLQAGV
jgi:hypothetical protein